MHALNHHVSTLINRSDNPPFRRCLSLSQTAGLPLTAAFASAATDAVNPAMVHKPIMPAQEDSNDDSEDNSENDEDLLSESLIGQLKEARDFKENAERERNRVQKQLEDLRAKKAELEKEAEAARQHRRTKQQLCFNFTSVYCNHDRPRKGVVIGSQEDATDPPRLG